MRRLWLSLCLVIGLGLAASPATAQTPSLWPTKPVKIIVPFGPGSTPDIVARVLADSLQQAAPGSTFIVENKPGASGNIGTDAVAKADPDGSTIGISIGGPLAINTLLFTNLKYDPAKDLAAVTQLVTQPSVLVVNTALGVNTVAELIALLKANPDKYNFGSIGVGSLSHLAMEAIAQKAGARIVHVPMQGSPAAVTALLRGDVQLGCLPAIAVTPQLASGQLKILAVSTAARSRFLPDVPTLKESGIEVEADAWTGLIAPAGMAPAALTRLHDLTVAAFATPAVKEKLATQLMDPVAGTPAQFRALIDAEISRWKPVIEAAHIKIN